MTGDPEDVPPLAHVVMPDVEQHGYRAYPLADHVADKACAIFERHGAAGTLSTRYRDLVDLVAIVLAAPVEAEPQMTALRSEAQRRGLSCRGDSSSRTGGSGNPATRPKRDAPSCRWRKLWTRP
jgi:Nucleotidyl transferase AbiEii toxin, Type IV TA system